MIDVFHRSKRDPKQRALFDEIAPLYTEFLTTSAAQAPAGQKKINPRPFLIEAEKRGKAGVLMAIELLELTNAHLEQSPWGGIRRFEWADVRELDDLFHSENLETAHGAYFDQRFVDFLATNFDDVDEINWRQFEGLAGEFFTREGFAVELDQVGPTAASTSAFGRTISRVTCRPPCSSNASGSEGGSQAPSSRPSGPISSTREPTQG